MKSNMSEKHFVKCYTHNEITNDISILVRKLIAIHPDLQEENIIVDNKYEVKIKPIGKENQNETKTMG